MAKGIVNNLLDAPREAGLSLSALLPATDGDSDHVARRAVWRWVKSFWLLVVVVLAGLTTFRGAVTESIASTPHPSLVYTIFAVAVVAAVLSGMLLATIVREYSWLERFEPRTSAERDALIAERDPAAPLSALFRLAVQTRELPVGQRKQALDHEVDSAEVALMGRAAIPNLLAGSLVGIGLVGTFVGLLGTLHDLSGVFSAFSTVGGDSAATFSSMIQKLRGPIQGMGTAFVASLYGLLGSLVIGVVGLSVRRVGDDLFTDVRLYVSEELYGGSAKLGDVPSEDEGELSSSMRILAAVTREEHAKMRAGMDQWSHVLDQRLAKVAEVTGAIGAEVQQAADYVGSAARRSVDSLEKARETNERLFFGMNEVSKGLIERLDALNRELADAGGRRQSRLMMASLCLSIFAVGAAIGMLFAPRAATTSVAAASQRSSTATTPANLPLSSLPTSAVAPSAAAGPSPVGAVVASAVPTSEGVVVRQGDTLSGLASRHGTPLSQVVAANPQIRNTDAVQVGQVVQVPKR